MKQEFVIKLQGKQYSKGRGKLFFMLLCFIVALTILMVYSSRYFIALLVPVFYLIFQLKNMSMERKILTDAICLVEINDLGIDLSVTSIQTKLCKTYRILYSEINRFTVNDRKVVIHYIDHENTKKNNQTIEFHVLPEDAIFWAELAGKINE